ncbi:MAG: T9SS type A sorting domain-containing protein [Saprospiraceae bacterium]|nr:T9SS type A sorting domain-containing protein [Candidatus Vicinibacter affinis]MBP6172700.1 T9SS type A sorting domain-containing protein [Saprospiraceae bacterium]MBK6574219.1 T9SS type A sorting domain-containing protein [Candidatus Vicinibacter affinis]MBK7302473.1 T9SS type A sorting domain-containing protein [Candidatus Vicinibacter affinis]MBK7695804.1 T9SS type A sorting domain-containing protein [Candidatus Vicinibacter affinis]
MNKYFLHIFFTISTYVVFAQDRTFFNLIPEIGAVKGQCVFGSIECDSQYIYIVGDEVVSQDSSGRNKKVKPHLTKFDYQGNLIHSKIIPEADFSRPIIDQNYPLFKRNDSIYYYKMYNWDDTTQRFAKNYIIAFDMRFGRIIKKIKVELPFIGDTEYATLSEMSPNSKDLNYVFRNVYSSQFTTDNYIYSYNDSLQQLSRIKVKNIQRLIGIRFIRFKEGYFHLIGDEIELKNNKLTDKGWLIYLKVDTLGNVLRDNRLVTSGNIYTNGGFAYTIKEDESNGYYIVTNDNIDVPNNKLIPHVFHVSSELDTVYWRTRFQHPLIMVGDNFQWINNMSLLRDSSGIVTCGSLHTPPFAEPSYGCIFKCSIQGDSLWTRLYQPLGWDSTRAWWMSMESMRTTPYNTLVVCGRVGDGLDQVTRGWLLHLDSEGCLVPGCDKAVSNSDIHSGKVKAFSVYPNPLVSSHLFLLSKISDQSKFNIELIDISGKVLHTSHFNPQQGAQYIIELPSEFDNGDYILKIQGKNFQQTEKIIVIR